MRPIHFYLLEDPIEILARDILLLEVLHDFELPIRQRTNTFLEIFGNVRVQKRTSKYIDRLGQQLRALVAHSVGNLSDIVDLSLLRYRDKDLLEDAFKGYSKSVQFDLDSLIDMRYRGLYEDRFDSRKALHDWDYHYTIKNKASIIHIKQYKEWRYSGIAFEFGDQTYTEPNKTLMSFVEGSMKKGKEKGIKKEVKGFWGDISVSPFFCFGIDCETPNKYAEELFFILNKNTGTEQHRHHSVEVSLYNLYSILWEIESGRAYTMTKKNDIYSGLGAAERAVHADLDIEDGEGNVQTNTLDKDDVGTGKEEEVDKTEETDASAVDGDTAIADEDRVTVIEDGDKEKDSEDEKKEDVVIELSDDEDEKEETAPAPPVSEADADEGEVLRAVKKAEIIMESYANVKVFPLTGSAQASLDKPAFRGFFHGSFVSSRAAQNVDLPYFQQIMRHEGKGSVVSVETSKFLVPLSKKIKEEFNNKVDEYASAKGWAKRTPRSHRRRRDEEDLEDDVLFYHCEGGQK